MQPSLKLLCRSPWILSIAVIMAGAISFADETPPREVLEIRFPDLSPSLFTMVTGKAADPILSYSLPPGFDPERRYPLLVYVPGFHGGPKGNIHNALTIAGDNDWVVASLPLFKSSIDREEVASGLLVGFNDYPAISKAYRAMLGWLVELVPNLDVQNSAMVGFSNGALTVAVLISSHDEFILTNFKNFCLVDHGMFHLTDLHKNLARESRYLILSGDNESDPGRDLQIRGGRLLQDSWRTLDVDITFHVMQNTGHEFHDPQMTLVGQWLRHEPISETERLSPAH